MKKLFFVLIAVCTLCLVACDDKDNDNKQETPACDAAACAMAENATEMACNEAGECVVKACAETFKVAEDAKSCEADAPACTCDPACKDNEDCIKGEGDKCECREKDKSAACDPACEDGKTKCECTNDACSCVPVNPPANECDGKSAGDECAEGKTCQDDNGALTCKDKPAPAATCDPACNAETEDCVCAEDKCECKAKDVPAEECFCDEAKTVKCPEGGKEACTADPSVPADACQNKSENDACGESKTCQKGEGDKLECKDKPADPAE